MHKMCQGEGQSIKNCPNLRGMASYKENLKLGLQDFDTSKFFSVFTFFKC